VDPKGVGDVVTIPYKYSIMKVGVLRLSLDLEIVSPGLFVIFSKRVKIKKITLI
jgi:hypothetical protein